MSSKDQSDSSSSSDGEEGWWEVDELGSKGVLDDGPGPNWSSGIRCQEASMMDATIVADNATTLAPAELEQLLPSASSR